jgi:hypothetical protein
LLAVLLYLKTEHYLAEQLLKEAALLHLDLEL